jgi:hypothetical protein
MKAMTPSSLISIQELVLQVDSFLYKKIPEDEESVFQEENATKMLQDSLTAEDVEVMRKKTCVEVTIHGQTTEQINIEGLEGRFLKENGHNRITIPSTDILQHQRKAGLPLHVTLDEALKDLKVEYEKICTPREEALKKLETDIKDHIEDMIRNGQTAEDTVSKVIGLTENIVLVNLPNKTVKRKMERMIGDALSDPNTAVDTIYQCLTTIIHDGVDHQILSNNKATRAKWGALVNRKGQIGENRTACAVNEAIQNFIGMSVMGMKTYTFLSEFLDKLNIQLTHRNVINPSTGKRLTTDEVEHDFVGTWLEKDKLVLNMIECKTTEVRPWSKPDKAKRAQAAVAHVKAALMQILKDMLTFKELFPDILEEDMKNIR